MAKRKKSVTKRRSVKRKKPAAKKKWMGRARTSMKKRGTVGAFTRYCRSKGFKGVTAECIRMGLRSSSATIRKRAGFAKAARTVARRRKKK